MVRPSWKSWPADDPLELRGHTAPWGRAAWLLALLVLVGLVLRVHHLSIEGFSDDELHKWLAAHRYLRGDFGGDDLEHPMLMKWLVTLGVVVGPGLGWAPETITRLPAAVAGAATILAVALLGRRLFGRAAALWAATLTAVSPTLIGYQRIAKEDALLGLFLVLLLWCVAEARAAADDGRTPAGRRWEVAGAAMLGLMMASKYFLFFAPIPLAFFLWNRVAGSRWRIGAGRWLLLSAVALAAFSAVNWTPWMPSSWAYGLAYMAERKTVSGSLYFLGHIYHNLPSYWLHGTPPWFYLVFATVKLAPPTVVLALSGLALALWRRRPAHRVVLTWLGLWFLILSVSGSKWGRFFVSAYPAVLLLAGHAAATVLATLRRRLEAAPAGRVFTGGDRWVLGALGLPALMALGVVGAEARAALAVAPHYRFYLNTFGGGPARLEDFFPHCDFYDVGFREAVDRVARRAAPGAELTSELDWTARYYARRAGRADLAATMLRPDVACRAGRECWVFLQPGRRYLANVPVFQRLSPRAPDLVVTVRGHDMVRVYRLPPGEDPFGVH